MKKIKKSINCLLLSFLVCIPTIANADSGLDSNYESSGSMIGGIINSIVSVISSFGKLIGNQPGDEDFNIARIIIVIICLIALYSVTAVYVFKLYKKNKIIYKLAIGLIPTLLFSLFCFLINLPIIVYILIFAIYIIPFVIISKIVIKNKLKKEIDKLKELNKKFNEEDFYKEAFNIYKDIQIAWCDCNLDKLKELLSDDMISKYTKKLEELEKNNQKNIMHDIEYKSSKITEVEIIENIVKLTIEMDVKCIDYIIDDKEKVVKGKKDKPYEYKYKLEFNKNMNNNKCILVEKKIKSIK